MIFRISVHSFGQVSNVKPPANRIDQLELRLRLRPAIEFYIRSVGNVYAKLPNLAVLRHRWKKPTNSP